MTTNMQAEIARLRAIEEVARAWRDADDAVLTLAGGPDYADEDAEVAAEERLDDAEDALRAALMLTRSDG